MRITVHLDIDRKELVDVMTDAITRASSRSTMSAPRSQSPPPAQAPKDPGELLRATKVAKMLDVEEATLVGWFYKGHGPKFIRVSGRAVRYGRADVDEWRMERRVRSTWRSERLVSTLLPSLYSQACRPPINRPISTPSLTALVCTGK